MPSGTMSELSLLGHAVPAPASPAEAVLERVPNPDPAATYLVRFACPEFTSLCPVTGQPDWAELTLNYLPDRLLVESKSLKEYLGSFRMHGDFHEDVCRIVCDDLTTRIQPRYLEVVGHFDARGSIAIWPYVQYAAPGDEEAAEILRHRRLNFSPGAWAPTTPRPA